MTQNILAFAAADHRLPDPAIANVRRLFADTMAGGAAGAASDEAQAMLGAVRGWGAGDESRLLGLDESLPTPSAAWFNGF
ncbi:MmgE/PrpD family protein, partial [Parasphingorhabdus sp.]